MNTNDYTSTQRLAYRLVYRALQKGTLMRPAYCQLCGQCGRICAHHWRGYDYPLDIWWICSRCNALLDCHDGTLTLESARDLIASLNRKTTIMRP